MKGEGKLKFRKKKYFLVPSMFECYDAGCVARGCNQSREEFVKLLRTAPLLPATHDQATKLYPIERPQNRQNRLLRFADGASHMELAL